MNKTELKSRTKTFSLAILKLLGSIPRNVAGYAISKQIVRSGTSVSANYRAACRAKSTKDFLNKLIIIEEECDETALWLELLMESGLLNDEQVQKLWKEADELTAIFTAAGKTVRDQLNHDK